MKWDRQTIVALDKRHLWHPYTPMDAYIADGEPIVAARAKGFYIFDHDGKRYMDGNGSWWTNIVGHNHPLVVQAVLRRAATMLHCSFADTTHEEAVRLAVRLLPRLGEHFTRLFFSDDGSTAVEVALRMAVQYQQNIGQGHRRRIVALSGAFHGETVGAASVSDIPVFHRALADMMFDVVRLPGAAHRDDPQWHDAAFAAARDHMEKVGDQVAAVIVEPLVQGAAGMLMYPPDYLVQLRRWCDAAGALLICDEVFTGYGRTGAFLAHHLAGIRPDIACLAKGFSGGELPFAATATTEEVFSAFSGGPDKTLWYGHSFTGNPLGCAVANAVLDVFDQERLLERLPEKEEAVAARLARTAAHRWVRYPRRTGIVAAFTLVDPDASGQDADYLSDAGWRFYRAAKERGAFLRPLGNVVYVALPLTVRVCEIHDLFDIIDDSLASAFGPF